MSVHDFPLAGMKVLVVEDDYLIGTDMAEALRRFGADVIGPVSACGEALALLDADDISTAVLDINLDGEAVFPVADELKSRCVPFILATGYDPATIPDAYREAVVIEKPYRMEGLSAALLRLAVDQAAPKEAAGDGDGRDVGDSGDPGNRDGLSADSRWATGEVLREPGDDDAAACVSQSAARCFAPDDRARFEI